VWPFTKTIPTLPKGCDFKLARDEFADFFRIANEDAAKHGAKVAYKTEFVQGWERFAANPCAQTAAAWFCAAPDYESLLNSYFTKCSPGGEFHAWRARRKAVTNEVEALPIKEQIKEFRQAIDAVVQDSLPESRANEAFKLVILTAAHLCFKKAEQFIKADDEKARSKKQFLINCEFFYFFMHLANRRFYTDHGEAIGQRWQNELGPSYIAAFLESVVGHWPQDLKDGIHSDLYDKINDAELNYSPCRGLYPEENEIFSGNTLFSKLAQNIAELAGTTNPVDQFLIMDGALKVFLRLSFQDCVNELAARLR